MLQLNSFQIEIRLFKGGNLPSRYTGSDWEQCMERRERILQGLRVAHAAVNERWPKKSRKTDKKSPFFHEKTKFTPPIFFAYIFYLCQNIGGEIISRAPKSVHFNRLFQKNCLYLVYVLLKSPFLILFEKTIGGDHWITF